MLNPSNQDVLEAIHIVSLGDISRAREIILLIDKYNAAISAELLRKSINGGSCEVDQQYILDASIVVSDLCECLNKLINNFTHPIDKPISSWRYAK